MTPSTIYLVTYRQACACPPPAWVMGGYGLLQCARCAKVYPYATVLVEEASLRDGDNGLFAPARPESPPQ